MAKAQTEKETAEEKPAEKGDLNNEESKKPQEGVKSTCQKDQVLYLFGRTGREKEEWFRRFLLASKLKSEVKKPPSGSKPGTQILYSCRSLLNKPKLYFAAATVTFTSKKKKYQRCSSPYLGLSLPP